MHQKVILYILITYSLIGYTWNATGHKLVAQIAYDNLSSTAKQRCSSIFNIKDPHDLQAYFINISTWLDKIREYNIHQFDTFHYIDLAFSKEKKRLPAIRYRNALSAINEAILVLSSDKSTDASRKLNLKILIHVVGDIHQPLHTTTKISRRFPKGDLGGNLYKLKSPYGTNLHQYWDNGAGTLIKSNLSVIKLKAYLLEKKTSCFAATQLKTPEDWIRASHYLAVNHAYAIRTHFKPSKHYRYNTIRIVDKQIAYAGCRLAKILNNSLTAY